MRLTTRHRQQSAKVPRISITQEEITADLIYPAQARRRSAPAAARARGKRR